MNEMRLLRRSHFFYNIKKKGEILQISNSLVAMEGSNRMNNFIFENTTKVYFGKGCVKEYLACLVKNYDKNVMFCYGEGSIKKNGIYEEVAAILKTTGLAVYEFAGIQPGPFYSKVLEGAEFARENQIGLILGAGGGSVTDFCKAVSIAAKYNGDIWADFWESPGVFGFEPLPVGIIPTVSGTGSECNGRTVIINDRLKIKTGRDYMQCSPRFALLDPSYTYSASKSQVISGGFSTLSHVMEIYFSGLDGDNVTDDIAEALIKNIIRNLRKAIYNPGDYTARSNLMWAAVVAADRITKAGKRGSSWCCQMVHQLEACTGCNYGTGLAVMLPVYYRHIYKDRLAKFCRFAVNVWGITKEGKSDEEIAIAGIEALEAFIKETGLPSSLYKPGMDKTGVIEETAVLCGAVPGSYNKMPYKEVIGLIGECF